MGAKFLSQARRVPPLELELQFIASSILRGLALARMGEAFQPRDQVTADRLLEAYSDPALHLVVRGLGPLAGTDLEDDLGAAGVAEELLVADDAAVGVLRLVRQDV